MTDSEASSNTGLNLNTNENLKSFDRLQNHLSLAGPHKTSFNSIVLKFSGFSVLGIVVLRA